jgi:hypothetical protein
MMTEWKQIKQPEDPDWVEWHKEVMALAQPKKVKINYFCGLYGDLALLVGQNLQFLRGE